MHGELDRRGFLEGAKKFAVGGISATAIWESLRPNYAWAQQVPKDDSRLKTEVRNAMASYRDGAFWWQKVYQPRVINVSSLTADETRTTPHAFLAANTPYTVAIHWRQAHNYLERASRQLAKSV